MSPEMMTQFVITVIGSPFVIPIVGLIKKAVPPKFTPYLPLVVGILIRTGVGLATGEDWTIWLTQGFLSGAVGSSIYDAAKKAFKK